MHLNQYAIDLEIITQANTIYKQQNYQMTSTITQQVQSIKLQNYLTVSLNTQFLTTNFQIIKDCLLRIQDLQGKVKTIGQSTQNIFSKLQQSSLQSGQQKSLIENQEIQINLLKKEILEDFNKKLSQVQKKANSNLDINVIADKLEQMNRFIQPDKFNDEIMKLKSEIDDVKTIRDSLDRFVDKYTFETYKTYASSEINSTLDKIDAAKQEQLTFLNKIQITQKKVENVTLIVNENTKMMKQINFQDMQERIRKHKEQTDNKIGEFVTKLKKKVGTSELNELEKKLVEKLDDFFQKSNADKAQKEQTKEALSFLEKRVNQLCQVFDSKFSQQEQQSLFSTTKWNCASCTKDLGKFQGKLGKFRPWAVFPCRQLNPQQTGAYGYVNYVDKMAYKKGFSIDDTNLQRLSKTFYDSNKQQSPQRKSNSRATNLMSNYGVSPQKNPLSLREQYFKKERSSTSKGFRFKKQHVKISSTQLNKVQEP